jgi:allophanate hydrolase
VAEIVLAIVSAHRAGAVTPERTLARTFARIRAHAGPAIFIALRDEADALAEARAFSAAGKCAPHATLRVAICTR